MLHSLDAECGQYTSLGEIPSPLFQVIPTAFKHVMRLECMIMFAMSMQCDTFVAPSLAILHTTEMLWTSSISAILARRDSYMSKQFHA